MYNLISGFLLIVILLNFVSADIITPGYEPIAITNKIVNLDEFPNYVFVSGPFLDEENGKLSMGSMCEFRLVDEEGYISGEYYKFCPISVYAIEKDKFDEELLFNSIDSDKVEIYLRENAIRVIKYVDHYTQVPIESTQKEVNNEYKIDLNKLIETPTNVKIERNSLIYFYILVPIIVLFIVLFVLYKRKS